MQVGRYAKLGGIQGAKEWVVSSEGNPSPISGAPGHAIARHAGISNEDLLNRNDQAIMSGFDSFDQALELLDIFMSDPEVQGQLQEACHRYRGTCVRGLFCYGVAEDQHPMRMAPTKPNRADSLPHFLTLKNEPIDHLTVVVDVTPFVSYEKSWIHLQTFYPVSIVGYQNHLREIRQSHFQRARESLAKKFHVDSLPHPSKVTDHEQRKAAGIAMSQGMKDSQLSLKKTDNLAKRFDTLQYQPPHVEGGKGLRAVRWLQSKPNGGWTNSDDCLSRELRI